MNDYLDFETDCGFPQCRAMSHKVNHGYCPKHLNYLYMSPEERARIKIANWNKEMFESMEDDGGGG